MSTVWKVLVALAVVVPLGAYVAGSLVASAADDPAPRHPIVLREQERTPHPSGRPTASPDSPMSPASPAASHDVEVITPEPHDVGDDHGGDHGDDHGGDRGGHDDGGGSSGHGSDDSGHGGGED